MKPLRRDSKNLFVCEECEKTFKICSSLSAHVGLVHNQRKYFDKWIKEDSEGVCFNCGTDTPYSARWNRGYSMFCSKKCKNEYGISESRREKIRKSLKATCNERYRFDAYTQTKEFKNKSQIVWNERYGVDNPAKNKTVIQSGKKTKKIKYGSETYNNPEKNKQTCMSHYGVEHPVQNKEIAEKCLRNSFKLKKFRDTDIWYQGSYELDFLEKYYDKYPDVTRAPSIKYIIGEKPKVYHPDFYIPSQNLVIECKNSYLMKKDVEVIKEKEKATISNGFNYVIIVNKNYEELNL